VSGPEPVPSAQKGIAALLESSTITIMARAELLQDRAILSATSASWADARADVAVALGLLMDSGQAGRIAENRRIAAWIERLAGEYDAEIECLDMALTAFHGTPDSLLGGVLNLYRALALAKRQRTAEARPSAERAALAPGPWLERIREQAWARIFAGEGRHADAAKRADATEGAAGEIPFPFARAEALIESGVVAYIIGDHEAAERRAHKALAVARSKESVAHERKATALLAGDLSRL
jgi:hypothetical protein